MRRCLPLASTFVALLGTGCGDTTLVATDAGTDAAMPSDAGSDSGAPWIGPLAPEAPRFGSCPAGWRPIAGPAGVVVGCDPWPATGRATCTAPDEAHFPGEPGCVRIGTACPAGDFPEGLPAGATIIYVRPGATGGDGTQALPFDTIAAAVMAAPDGAVIALAKGTYAERVYARRSATFWGACVAETIIEPAVVTGFALIAGATDVRVQNLSIRGAQGATLSGGGLTLRDVVIADSMGDGLGTFGGTATLDTVLIRRSAFSGILNTRATVDGRRVVIDAPEHGAIIGIEGAVTLSDVSLSDVRTSEDFALQVQTAGRLALERFALEGYAATAVLEGSTFELRDGIVRSAESTVARMSDALQVAQVSHASLTRVRFDGALANAIFVAEMSELTMEDCTIASPVFQSPGYGRAIDVERGGQAVVRRSRIDGATQVGVLVADVGSSVTLEDVVVRETLSDPDGHFGRAVQAQSGATLTAMRVRLEGSREAALVGAGLGTRIDATDLDIEDTRERACSADTCAGAGGGIGVGSYLEALISLQSTRIRRSVLAGMQIARDGALDIHLGEVTDNAVGANVQVDGYDFARLTDRVAYLRNGTNLDSRTLPVPDPTPPR